MNKIPENTDPANTYVISTENIQIAASRECLSDTEFPTQTPPQTQQLQMFTRCATRNLETIAALHSAKVTAKHDNATQSSMGQHEGRMTLHQQRWALLLA